MRAGTGAITQCVRLAQRRPVHTAFLILTLALGIGSATASYAVLDGVLFSPLPYPDPARLATVWQTYRTGGQIPRSNGRGRRLGFRTRTTSQFVMRRGR